MQIIKYPSQSQWSEILKRPIIDNSTLFEQVGVIIDEVRQHGDKALRDFTLKFDGVSLENLEVTKEEIAEAEQNVQPELKQAIEMARRNIWKFHSAQQREFSKIETSPGVFCWQKSVAIEKVGLYIPGGSAPLFSTVLMLGIPAQIAECKEIVLCTPPNKTENSSRYTLRCKSCRSASNFQSRWRASHCCYGVWHRNNSTSVQNFRSEINTATKQLVSLHGVAIDMPAGPSEVEVMADRNRKSYFRSF